MQNTRRAREAVGDRETWGRTGRLAGCHPVKVLRELTREGAGGGGGPELRVKFERGITCNVQITCNLLFSGICGQLDT